LFLSNGLCAGNTGASLCGTGVETNADDCAYCKPVHSWAISSGTVTCTNSGGAATVNCNDEHIRGTTLGRLDTDKCV